MEEKKTSGNLLLSDFPSLSDCLSAELEMSERQGMGCE